jgi:Nucleotidyl transferase AbiEii toxin, Type IV TA system
MSLAAYQTVLASRDADRRDLFLSTATRLGAPLANIEKDFWVCWTLQQLYHERAPDSPRLLFKGGTSLSKGYDLIRRFSEDIDITVFRDDLDEPASVDELEALSGKKRQARLNGIRDACHTYIAGPLHDQLAEAMNAASGGAGRVELDKHDRDGQTLMLWYPSLEADPDTYIRPAVRIESGAKSALDPHEARQIRPYSAEEATGLELLVPDVMTIQAERTFWDKVVILHGLRKWFERRGELRQEGQRISRHYYDLHMLVEHDIGAAAADAELGADCVRHARMFFNRSDFDLASAGQGSFALTPADGMMKALERDYAATVPMIFGDPPAFADIMTSVRRIEAIVNGVE